MRRATEEKSYIDQTAIVLTTPVEGTVWMGDSRRGIVREVRGGEVALQAIFDGVVDVRDIPFKKFCAEYVHTPKVSARHVHEVHRSFAEHSGATARARAVLSTFQPTSQEELDMATKKTAAPKTEKKTAAPKTEKKTAAPKTEKKTAASTARGRKSAFEPDMKITVLVDENPKRGTAAVRFGLYAKNNTVEKYLAAGGLAADLRWDVKQEFIKVE